jgi:oligopeptidase A
MNTRANPLLDFSDLPVFDAIEPSDIASALDVLLANAEKALETVTAPDYPANWSEISSVLDVSVEKLSRAWGAVNHLHSVADSPELRAAYTEALPRVTAFYTRMGADERLYAKYKAIAPASLNAEQKRAHTLAVRNFVLSGAELTGLEKKRFAEIQERMADVSQKFSENVLDATDQWSLLVTAEELAGVPADILEMTKANAEKAGLQGYQLSLKMPCYLPIMQFAHSSVLREKLYRAYVTRASNQFEAKPSTVSADATEQKSQDNTTSIQEILALRHEEAQLLGYANYAEVSLASKMAQSPAEVMTFLRDLAKRARPYAEKDVTELREFAAKQLNLKDPQAWDWTYIGEKLKEARYAFSEQEVKMYFIAPKVLAGLFKIVETLFEVSIRKDTAPVWHEGVEFFRIERSGALVGQFYLDPGARSGKRGGAWMDDVRARWLRPDNQQLQTPVAHLVCNFAEGAGGKPPLLTHDDVITLFHECGHGLHHMLTQINERDVSGISGVEWDAVELPSQFMENFCWEWSVLRHMTSHVDTGEPLPRELFDKMLAAKNFQSGLQTLRQIEFSLFDMRLHCEGEKAQNFMQILQEVRDEVSVLQPPAWSRTPHTFSHIFAGGYAAGYYSYKWAEVLSADAYAAFEETAAPDGSPNIETGRKYREAILEAGGSRTAMESFKAFRGREPQLDALLRHQGMN